MTLKMEWFGERKREEIADYFRLISVLIRSASAGVAGL
jgi:hypothetical protein